jgi:hypothetical protein
MWRREAFQHPTRMLSRKPPIPLRIRRRSIALGAQSIYRVVTLVYVALRRRDVLKIFGSDARKLGGLGFDGVGGGQLGLAKFVQRIHARLFAGPLERHYGIGSGVQPRHKFRVVAHGSILPN